LEEVKERGIELLHLNVETKSTLMILLNYHGMMNITRYKAWVQTTVMDTEERISNLEDKVVKGRL
jgi:hypothetical protein